jgi:integrase
VASGQRVTAGRTFRTRAEASDWLATERTRLVAGDAPRGRMSVAEATERWMSTRTLSVRTSELYGWLVRHYFGPIADRSVRELTTEDVARWLPPGSSGAKAYRLLAAVLRWCVAEGFLGRSPCVLRGAGIEHAPERPVLSVDEVEALAEAMEPYGLAVRLAAWCHRRRGEVLGLRWEDVDGDTLTVRRAVVRTMGGDHIEVAPKTRAGRRTLVVPPHLVASLTGTEGPVVRLTGPQLDRRWRRAREAVGIDAHFHDLRHSGLTWTAASGATVAELMSRAGHASPAAAMRYQHATRDRDRALAAALGSLWDARRMREGDSQAL